MTFSIRKIGLATVLVLAVLLFGCNPKQELSIHQKMYFTAKVWGFLKYYHPTVNEGKINWDDELIAIMQKLASAHTSEELSTVFINWIESLGEVAPVTTHYDNARSFNRNFNLSWFENDFFTKELTSRLLYIEQNRSQKLHYVTKGYVNQVEITNEHNYTSSQWSDQDIRLVTLFRYWNVIEYFYPYKYEMDTRWDDILEHFIPKFMETKTELDYHLLITELTVSLCDSHAFFRTPLTSTFAGKKFIPADFKIINDKAVIVEFYDDSLVKLNDIRLGDAILAVDQVPVIDIYKKNKKYIAGSNEAVKKLENAYRCIFNGATDSVSITFEREGIIKDKTIGRYDYSVFKSPDTPPVKWKKLADSIGYVNMEEEVVSAADLPAMMKELKSTKAVIFDFRKYPEFIIDELLGYLNATPKDFAKFIHPDFTYPGRFWWSDPVQCGKVNPEPYKGKVIILVDEDTQSRSEYFVMAMQTVDGAITIGRQTSGADGDVVDYTFFDENTSWFTGNGVFYPDGKKTQRVGVAIDIEVPIELDDIVKGRDTILEKAIEIASKL